LILLAKYSQAKQFTGVISSFMRGHSSRSFFMKESLLTLDWEITPESIQSFEKELQVNRVNVPEKKVDRSLTSNYSELSKIMGTKDMRTALTELRNFMNENTN